VEFYPCDSRVGKLAVTCDADTIPFTIYEFSFVVTLFIFGEFSYLYFSEFISNNNYLVYSTLVPDYPLLTHQFFCCIYLLSMIYHTHLSSPYFLDAADANIST
jgi:hypothetical protein